MPAGASFDHPKVFICYRRDDSAVYADRIFEKLREKLGAERVFMDVDGIPLGVDYARFLHQQIAQCGYVLALIGKDWLEVRDESGKRRLDNPNDYVRIELRLALARDVPVVPILLDGATIPPIERLPEDLEALSGRQSLMLTRAGFNSQIQRLTDDIKRAFEQRPRTALPFTPPSPDAASLSVPTSTRTAAQSVGSDASTAARFVNFAVDGFLWLSILASFPSTTMSSQYVGPLIYGVFIAYYVLFESIWQITPGKWLTGTRVVNADGSRPVVARIFLRTLVRFVPFEWLAFLRGSSSGWHDRWSRTRVVVAPRPKLSPVVLVTTILAVTGLLVLAWTDRTSSLKVSVTTYGSASPDVRVTVDGKDPCSTKECSFPRLTPGEHRVEAVANGYTSQATTVVLAGGEERTITLFLSPRETPHDG